MFASNGILFNHESPRRGHTFVTRKITRGIAAIMAGKTEKLYLGNLDARRDWGYAPEYVEAMWLMLQHERADDFVIATGEMHSVREFVTLRSGSSGGTGTTSSRSTRATFARREVDELEGDASKAARLLGWKPRTTFRGARPPHARGGPPGERPGSGCTS